MKNCLRNWGKALQAGGMAIAIAAAIAPGVLGQTRPYTPTPIQAGQIEDMLTEKDIPTGQKGFARDYTIAGQPGDRLEVMAVSKEFDPIVSVLGAKGDVLVENDDGLDEGTDSLLYFKVLKEGTYTIRVRSFGGSTGGRFTLTVTRLVPANLR